MPARFQWTSAVIRFYRSDAEADAGAPFEGIVSINRCGERAFLFGLHANLTRQHRRDLVACLLDQGITHTTDIRRGRWHERDLRLELQRHSGDANE